MGDVGEELSGIWPTIYGPTQAIHFLQGGQWWYHNTQETTQPMRLANNYFRAGGVGEFMEIAAGCEVVAGAERPRGPPVLPVHIFCTEQIIGKYGECC